MSKTHPIVREYRLTGIQKTFPNVLTVMAAANGGWAAIVR